jgi:site-specific DNA recombinase
MPCPQSAQYKVLVHGAKACSNHLTRENTLCLAILNDIRSLLSSLDSTSYIETIEAKVQKQRLLSQKQINSAKEEMAALKSKKQKAVGLLIDEVISKEAYDEYINDINQQIHTLTINVQELDTHLQTKDDETSIYELKKQLEAFVEFKELTPELLHRLIEKVEIKADGKAKVHYRTSTPSAYSLTRFINAQHSTCAG